MASPPLRQRIGFADRTAEQRADRGVMARALMYMFALGALMALVAAATAVPGDRVHLGVAGLVCCASAAALLIGYDRLPYWAFTALAGVACGLVLWTVYEDGSAFEPLLALPVAYVAFFARKLELAALLAACAGGYAAAATAGVAQASWHEVAVPVVALGAVAGLVGMQRANVNRLIWRLSDAAVTDSLTGLLNRRGFQQLFDTELERARRSGQPLSLIVGDLDNFKSLNDRYGHGAGDRALEQLALILGTAKRRIDTAARIGGEEFAMILPDSDHHAALILAERMRREVRETFMYEPHELTISLGVATFPLHGTEADVLVALADEALYAAKALGRDRTVVFSGDLSADVEAATGSSPRRARHAATVLALADVVDARDRRTAAHSQEVGRYAAAIARELGLPEEAIEQVRFGGIVHDVGKIAVPDSVLRKPGWLSAEEWHEMRRHPEVGARILAGASLGDVSAWVLAHHERPDGGGYPSGLAADSIPLEARILAVADAYEAMTSHRVYREALGPDEARAELVRCSGSQFDKVVVDAFLRVLDGSSEARGLRLVR
jgi:diguanylate cyclase (GGDEF)-like protein